MEAYFFSHDETNPTGRCLIGRRHPHSYGAATAADGVVEATPRFGIIIYSITVCVFFSYYKTVPLIL